PFSRRVRGEAAAFFRGPRDLLYASSVYVIRVHSAMIFVELTPNAALYGYVKSRSEDLTAHQIKLLRELMKDVVDEPDVRAIRKAADISQSQLASLIGVNLRTLQTGNSAERGPRARHGHC